jgi:ketosteroid isomerase-like protein
MSQENVDIVREAIEARNRDLDEWLTFFDPNVETSDLLSVAGMPTGTHGLDELRQTAAEWTEILDDYREEIVELLDKGAVVLAEVRFHGQGGASGASVELTQIDFYRLHEGRIIEFRAGYRSHEQALEAAGLRE